MLETKPFGDWVCSQREDNGDGGGCSLGCLCRCRPVDYDDIYVRAHKVGRKLAHPVQDPASVPLLDCDVPAFDVAERSQALAEGIRIASRVGSLTQESDACKLRRLLRPCRERPRRRRAAEQRDELAPPHSITSSASARNGAGTVRSIALAVLRLMTSSNFADCSTGRSAGFVPRRILSAYSAARRYMLEKFTP